MRTLREAAERGSDNVLWLRHGAALLVIWAHAFALSSARVQEPLARLLGGFDAGRLAVYLFFALSGFLIALSLQRHDDVLRYAWHRALRILPAYWVCLGVCVFGVGLGFTTMAAADYLHEPTTWSYFTANVLPLSMQWGLPGVFETHPFPRVVNASLWSLGAEIRWYFYFGVLALLHLFRHRVAFSAVAVVLVADALRRHGLPPVERTDSAAITLLFVFGALAALWRDWLVLSWRWMAVLVVLTALLWATPFAGTMMVVCCAYAALLLGYRTPPLVAPKADRSYGLFLYGAPMQQSCIAMWPDVPPLALFVIGALSAGQLAALSWHGIERPALRAKSWFDRAPR